MSLEGERKNYNYEEKGRGKMKGKVNLTRGCKGKMSKNHGKRSEYHGSGEISFSERRG
jgi:hypothetical protein